VSSRYCKDRSPFYYIFDSAAQKYLSSSFDWNDRGAKIPNMDEVKKRLRVIAERREEASRPKDWERIPHTYADLPATSFIPSEIAVVDECSNTLLRGRDMGQQFLIQVWQPRSTN
jgi:hypothetical protein